MNTHLTSLRSLAALLVAALITIPSFAQGPTSSPNAASIPSDSPKTSGAQSSTVATSPVAAPSAPPSEAAMKQMIELAKLNEHHKLLADPAGPCSYTDNPGKNPY